MSRFEGLLRKSLGSKLDAVVKAYADLNEVINELNGVIEREADGIAELKLTIISESMNETIYRLQVNDKHFGKHSQILDHFSIGGSGYPILQGNYANSTRDRVFVPSSTFPDKAELEEYFAAYLVEPQSPVLTFLAFIKRKADGGTF